MASSFEMSFKYPVGSRQNQDVFRLLKEGAICVFRRDASGKTLHWLIRLNSPNYIHIIS